MAEICAGIDDEVAGADETDEFARLLGLPMAAPDDRPRQRAAPRMRPEPIVLRPHQEGLGRAKRVEQAPPDRRKSRIRADPVGREACGDETKEGVAQNGFQFGGDRSFGVFPIAS